MVCDALADFPLDGTFEEAIEAARRACSRSTTICVRTAAGATSSDRSGSTVVVLLVRGARSAVLWAGDSRVYRWRDGTLEQLTAITAWRNWPGPTPRSRASSPGPSGSRRT